MKAGVGLLLVALSAGAWGQNPPELPFQATSTPPTIDGNLETGEWAAASQVTGFIDIVTSAAAPEETQAWLTSDAELIFQGTRRHYIYSEFSDPTIRGGIHGMSGSVFLEERQTQSGGAFSKSASFDGSLLTAQDLRLGISLATSEFQGLPSRSAGLFFTINERNRFSRFNGFINGGVIDGDPSRYTSFRAEQRLAPGLDMSLGWQQLDWRGKTEQTQLSMGYEINAYQSLNGRVVWQDGESNAYLAFRQGGREGLDVYFILGDANADRTRNRAALKLVWAF